MSYQKLSVSDVVEHLEQGDTVKSCSDRSLDIETVIEDNSEELTEILYRFYVNAEAEYELLDELRTRMRDWIEHAASVLVIEHNALLDAEV